MKKNKQLLGTVQQGSYRSILILMLLTSFSTVSAAGELQKNWTTSSTTAQTFEQLESEIFLAEPEKLSLIEQKVGRQMQENPNSSQIQYAMSSILLRMFLQEPTNTSLLKQSADLAAQAYDLDPKSDYGVVALASILDVTGETTKGLALMKDMARKKIPQSWRSHLVKAKLLSSEQDVNEVLAELRLAMLDKGANRQVVAPYIAAMLSAAYEGKSLIKASEAWSKEFPCDEFKLATAQFQLKSGLLPQALTNYRDVLKTNPNSAEAHLGEGFILLRSKKDYKGAVKALRSAISLEMPLYLKSEAQLQLATALIKNGQIAEGQDQAIESIKNAPNPEKSLAFITDELSNQKRYRDAIDLLNRINTVTPGLSLNHALKGEVLATRLSKPIEAVDAFSDAIVLDDTKSAYYNGRGLAYYSMRLMDRALVDFETASRVDPSDASARYNAACALALLGRKNEALEALASALDLDDRLSRQALVDRDFITIRGTTEFQSITGVAPATPFVAH